MTSDRSHRAKIFLQIILTLVLVAALAGHSQAVQRPYNGPYTGPFLNRVAFRSAAWAPVWSAWKGPGRSRTYRFATKWRSSTSPVCLRPCVSKARRAMSPRSSRARSPSWKIFGGPGTGNGKGHTSYGFPRFLDCEFQTRFPFAEIKLADSDIPLASRSPVGAVRSHRRRCLLTAGRRPGIHVHPIRRTKRSRPSSPITRGISCPSGAAVIRYCRSIMASSYRRKRAAISPSVREPARSSSMMTTRSSTHCWFKRRLV